MANYLDDEDNYDKVQNLGENWCAEQEETAWVHFKQSFSQRFAQQAETDNKNIGKKDDFGLLPPEYHEYKSVFGKKESDRLPEH